MDTQNTPVHIHLWNKDFWHLALSTMLVSMAVYMQWAMVCRVGMQGGSPDRFLVLAMGGYSVGLLLLGGCCSFLVQRFRRNKVAITAMLAVAACMALPALFPKLLEGEGPMGALRVCTGAFFGLAQMVLLSTLVIDTCEALHRTEANYAVAWFGRFAVSLGPLAALLVARCCGPTTVAWGAAAVAVVAAVMVMTVKFPFRTPEDNVRLFSLDRFVLPQAWGLGVNLVLVTTVMGMVMVGEAASPKFFAALMPGFFLALLAEKYVFVNAELKSETVAGLLLTAFAILLKITGLELSPYVVPVLIGLGIGLVASRFQLFFIKMSQHSKRGTSQSSFFVAWEVGLAIGWWVACSDVPDRLAAFCGNWTQQQAALAIALALTIAALLMYVGFTHQWYVKHKNR